jgi:hypothetical protein
MKIAAVLVPSLVAIVAVAAIACGSSETTPSTGASDGGSSSSGGSSSGGTSSSGSVSSSSGGSSGGSSGSNADGGKADQEAAYCAARASHATCNDGSTLSCDAEGKCLYGNLMTATAASTYNACYSAPSCKSDDTCARNAGLASGGAAATAYESDCVAKMMACSISGKGELCSGTVYAYTGVGEAFAACLSKACNEIDACFDAALAPVKACK